MLGQLGFVAYVYIYIYISYEYMNIYPFFLCVWWLGLLFYTGQQHISHLLVDTIKNVDKNVDWSVKTKMIFHDLSISKFQLYLGN